MQNSFRAPSAVREPDDNILHIPVVIGLGNGVVQGQRDHDVGDFKELHGMSQRRSHSMCGVVSPARLGLRFQRHYLYHRAFASRSVAVAELSPRRSSPPVPITNSILWNDCAYRWSG